jgi:PST family polysaccharide transporter
VASSKFLIAENLTRITFYKSIIGAVANIILNLMLIPIFGIIGSAVATLISYFISNFAVVLFKESRIVAKMLFYAFWPFKLFTRNYYRGIFIEKD